MASDRFLGGILCSDARLTAGIGSAETRPDCKPRSGSAGRHRCPNRTRAGCSALRERRRRRAKARLAGRFGDTLPRRSRKCRIGSSCACSTALRLCWRASRPRVRRCSPSARARPQPRGIDAGGARARSDSRAPRRRRLPAVTTLLEPGPRTGQGAGLRAGHRQGQADLGGTRGA